MRISDWSSDVCSSDLQAEAVVELADERPGLGLTPVADALPWEGPEAVLVTHDAHASGHSALHLPELGVLVAGDMGSDIEDRKSVGAGKSVSVRLDQEGRQSITKKNTQKRQAK